MTRCLTDVEVYLYHLRRKKFSSPNGAWLVYQLPPMHWLRAFEAAARRESFTAAAGELCRTPKAVSNQVRALESHLGFPLFERLPHGLRLTDTGRAYLPSVRKAFEDLSATTAGLFGPLGTRTLTIRATIPFAVFWLTPRLLDFRAAFPDIRIRLCTVVWTDALPPDQFDLDIRLGDGQWPGYQIELIRAESVIPACSHATYSALGPYRRPADLWDREHIHILGQENFWTRFFRSAGIEDALAQAGITVDTAFSAIELAVAGRGHAMLLKSFTEAPDFGARMMALHELAMRPAGAQRGHYLLIPERAEQTGAEVLLFRDWLLDTARSG